MHQLCSQKSPKAVVGMFVFILFICSVKTLQSNNNDKSELKYATPYNHQNYVKCSAYSINKEVIKTDSDEASDRCDCVPVKDFTIDKYQYRLCEANWAGNFDLWIIKCKNNICDKPLLTPFSTEVIKQRLCEHNDVCGLKDEDIIVNKIFYVKTRNLIKIGFWYTKKGSVRERKRYLVFNFDMDAIKNDIDKDGLTDILENEIGTDLNDKDTDHDGITDNLDNNPVVSNKTMNTDESKIFSAVFNDQYNYIKNDFIFNVYQCRFEGSQYYIGNNNILFLSKENKMNGAYGVSFKDIRHIDKNNVKVDVIYSYYQRVAEGYQYELIKRNDNWVILNKKANYWE